MTEWSWHGVCRNVDPPLANKKKEMKYEILCSFAPSVVSSSEQIWHVFLADGSFFQGYSVYACRAALKCLRLGEGEIRHKEVVPHVLLWPVNITSASTVSLASERSSATKVDLAGKIRIQNSSAHHYSGGNFNISIHNKFSGRIPYCTILTWF